MDDSKPDNKPTEKTATPAANSAPASENAVAAPVQASAAAGADAGELGFVLDIPLKVSVELGKSRILVQDLIKLHKGSVIELNKMAGEALEVLVNDRIVAKGEVIVVNEKFGVRLTDIVSHTQRIRQLGE